MTRFKTNLVCETVKVEDGLKHPEKYCRMIYVDNFPLLRKHQVKKFLVERKAKGETEFIIRVNRGDEMHGRINDK